MRQGDWKKYSLQIFATLAVIGIAYVFCFFVFQDYAWAQSVADSNSELNQGVAIIKEPLGLPSTDIRLIIARIIRTALGLVGIVLVCIIIYAGFLWMTSGGNEEQLGKAKKILKNAVIGLVIILSAYSIVLFIIKLLGIDTGSGETYSSTSVSQNLYGSGSLGRVIKDHYPTRDQTDVARNTKIVISFRRPILASSAITDKNGNGIYGDCVTPAGRNFSWVDDCDRIITSAGYVNITASGTTTNIPAAALVSESTVNKVKGVYTLVLKPLTDLTAGGNGGYLGSASENISYKVYLGNNIKIDDVKNGNPALFKSEPAPYYEWKFTCGMSLDLSPPYVQSVFPASGSSEAKNTVIQIDFNEAMDPIGIQGSFFMGTGQQYYTLDGNNIYLHSSKSTIPLGSFNITNGYRTLEFTSSLECGKNACGNKIYCLPVCDKPGASCQNDTYELLLQAGKTMSASSFEAYPFSGLMDLAGNALDANKNLKVDATSTPDQIFPKSRLPDNYYWSFILKDEIDATSPYLTQIAPGLDMQNVSSSQPWEMVFSKRMRVEPMYDVGIDEYPTPIVRCGNIVGCSKDSLWRVPRVYFGEGTAATTVVKMSHGLFISSIRQYYYPIISSTVEDAHYNCFYPAMGPGQPTAAPAKRPNAWTGQGAANLSRSRICNGGGTDCCAVSSSSAKGAFCCNGLAGNTSGVNVSTTAECEAKLILDSPR